MFKSCCIGSAKKSKSKEDKLNKTVNTMETEVDDRRVCGQADGEIDEDCQNSNDAPAVATKSTQDIKSEQVSDQSNSTYRRKQSNGILKSTTSYGEEGAARRLSRASFVRIDDTKTESVNPSDDQSYMFSEESLAKYRRQMSDDDDDDDEVFIDAIAHPPATPVGRDEVALRRHRAFSELLTAAQAALEHRVRFDPHGPHIRDCDRVAIANLSVQSPISQFSDLIVRLECVTQRLEHLNIPTIDTPFPFPDVYCKECVTHQNSAYTTTQVLDSHKKEGTLPGAGVTFPADSTDSYRPVNMSVNGFQDIVQGPLQSYLSLSQRIGSDVATQAALVNSAFQAQLQFVQTAAQSAKPSQAQQMQLLSPTSQQIAAIQDFREKHRTSPFFNHLSAISESIPALGWVAVSPAPSPYVKEMNDAGQFYSNRVLKDWKEKDRTHVEWCGAWVQLLKELQAYVKQYHTTGLVWSGTGACPPPPPGGMPPPPPCLPPADFAALDIGDDRNALFAQINQGADITKALKKVTSDMQTHKNPTLREGPAPFKAPASGPTPRGPGKALPTPGAGQLPDKPPVFNRDGKKWLIEYQKGNQNLVVDNAEMNNVVYMFRCRDSALTVKGKINGVVLDSCTKCAVVFDNLVSSVEFVNCQSVQMQVLGKVPTITIDKTDGCQMYLSPDSLDVEIVSSKSSEMNVLVPKSNGDYTELPIPEQYKTTLKKPATGLETVAVESKG